MARPTSRAMAMRGEFMIKGSDSGSTIDKGGMRRAAFQEDA
jgi:hypothetical protein